MNKNLGEAEYYAQELRAFLEGFRTSLRLFIVPPFTVLARVCEAVKGSPVMVGAQNMHWAEAGPFTGEISPVMLKDCGAQIVELGHSERRAAFGETDQAINRKVVAALRHDLIPVICVGETEREKEARVAVECVARQVKIALDGVPAARLGDILIAYEPVWAIGESGKAAQPEYADAMHAEIKRAVGELFGSQAAREATVLYGGSVSASNAETLMKQEHVDGLFVGRAAWDVSGFINLIRIVESARGL